MGFNKSGKYEGTKVVSRALAERMNSYDSYPKEIREVLRDAPYAMGLDVPLADIKLYGVKVIVRSIKRGINESYRRSCARVWGEHHPNAQQDWFTDIG